MRVGSGCFSLMGQPHGSKGILRVTRNNGTTEAKVEPAILAYSFPLAGSLHWIGQKRKAMSRKDREKKPHHAEQAEAEMRNAGAETPEGPATLRMDPVGRARLRHATMWQMTPRMGSLPLWRLRSLR